jgi:hypothetical protein
MAENYTTWVTAEVIRAVAEIQVQCGREVGELNEHVVPLLDLGGFDSLNCLEAAVLLTGRLGVEVEHRVFATKRGQPISCADIARTIIGQHGLRLVRPSEEAA